MRRRIKIALLALLLFPLAAQAQEKEKKESVYKPEFCEFSVTFPEEPYKTHRCDGEDNKKCYDLVSYTQVFELDATVNFRVICNPVDNKVRETYSGDVMKATLQAMTRDSVVKTFETTFREEKEYKQAGLVGEGNMGRTPTIYIAQLWIGNHSALSVEAELIGENSDPADELFSRILKSVRYTATETADKPPEEARAPAKENAIPKPDGAIQKPATEKPKN